MTIQHWDFERLRSFEGQEVILRSVEAEAMRAFVSHVDREHRDMVIDIFETNQPERYRRLGREYSEGAWVMPFEFIASIKNASSTGEATGAHHGGRRPGGRAH